MKFTQSLCGKSLLEFNGDSQQIIGREGETATLFWRCPLNFGGLGGGFAPRQFNRYAAHLIAEFTLLSFNGNGIMFMITSKKPNPDIKRNFKWEEFKFRVEHYKYFLNIALQVNAFFYLTTGGVLGFFLKDSTQQAKDNHLVFFLLLPILIGSVLGGIFLYGAELQEEAFAETEILREELKDLGLKIKKLPDAQPLHFLFTIFGVIFFIVVIALILVPIIIWFDCSRDLKIFTVLAFLILCMGMSLPMIARCNQSEATETFFTCLARQLWAKITRKKQSKVAKSEETVKGVKSEETKADNGSNAAKSEKTGNSVDKKIDLEISG